MERHFLVRLTSVNVMSLLFALVLPAICHAFYKPLYFLEDEVRHVRSPEDRKPLCDEDKLVEYLAERQISSPESIVTGAISDFEGSCTATSTTLRKVDEFMSNCTAPKGLYANLLSGLKTFDEKLCKTNDFYRRYDKFDECYKDLDKDYESCNGAPDWNESEQERACRIYKRIVDCFYIKTAKVCGIRAALTLKELLVEVIDCTLQLRCPAGSDPRVKDAMPEKYLDTLEGGRGGTGVFIHLHNAWLGLFIIHSIWAL